VAEQAEGTARGGVRLWCRRCGQRVVLATGGDPEYSKAVHAVTGNERGNPDGHLAAPVDAEPPLWRAAREIAARYGGAFTVEARFGFLRADWSDLAVPPGVTAAHYEADTDAEMYTKLDAAVRGTRWERAGR
jgi:hypothetical protein